MSIQIADFDRLALVDTAPTHEAGTAAVTFDPQTGVVDILTRAGHMRGSSSFDVWHGRTYEFDVATNLDGDTLRTVLEELEPLFARISAGHSVRWNGSNNVGRLTDDALDACDEISAVIDRLGEIEPQIPVWEVGDWLLSAGLETIRDEISRMGIDAYVADCLSEAAIEGLVLVGDLRESLDAILAEDPEGSITITIDASRYEDLDDCLAAAAEEICEERDLVGWDLSPRWGDPERTTILVDIPASAVAADDDIGD